LTWAAIFAVLFHGTYVSLARRIGRNRAALLTTLVAGIVIVAPALVLISALARESPQVAAYLTNASQTAPRQIQRIWDAIRSRSPIAIPEDPTDLLTRGAQRALAFLAPHAGAFLADIFAMLGALIVMLFALFFMLRDGTEMARHVREMLPVSTRESERLLADTRDLVIASVGAGAIVATAQGLIGGLGFWIAGLGAPVFWGVVIAVSSLLPVVGAALVWIPAAIGLLVSGHIGQGVLLSVIGVFGISLVDNVLRPLLLSGRTSMNGLVVFLGLLGGAAAFGFIGLVIGPIILVTTTRLIELLRHPDQPEQPPPAEDPIIAP
jgi:predicted PurR-regulated permease PerM